MYIDNLLNLITTFIASCYCKLLVISRGQV